MLVRTRGPVLVLDSVDGPVMVLGMALMSAPPQGTGPALDGWAWGDRPAGTVQEAGGVRWGSFVLTGGWDGARLRVREAVPAAAYDAGPGGAAEPDPPPPRRPLTPARLRDLTASLAALPGALDAYADPDGRVWLDVVADDGTLQERCDREHGVGVVVVTTRLVPLDDTRPEGVGGQA